MSNDYSGELSSKLMMNKNIENNLKWFVESGVMSPADGSWGVAERIVLTHDNDAMDKIVACFPFHTANDDHIIIENRRPDCCFQTALMFHMASEYLGQRQYREIADNILDYLYNRSGSLKHEDGPIGAGLWRWSHCDWSPSCWLDDNAWCITIPLLIASRENKLEARFDLTSKAIRNLDSLLDLIPKVIDKNVDVGGTIIGGQRIAGHLIAGDFALPHWGSLVCMAIAAGYQATGQGKYMDALSRYARYMELHRGQFNNSEHAYHAFAFALVGKWADEEYYDLAHRSATLLIRQMNSCGIIPSQHSETSVGDKYIDLIYTTNWAMLAFLLLYRFTGNQLYYEAWQKCMKQILQLQIEGHAKYLNGCWRGLFDVESESYAGGDRYEGGANSVYTGWTNAPITIGMLLAQIWRIDEHNMEELQCAEMS